jgi:hypothetical protein
MSRSKKGGKGAGYEYWGKRPLSGSSPGRIVKKMTHQVERAQAKENMKGLSEDETMEEIKAEVKKENDV